MSIKGYYNWEPPGRHPQTIYLTVLIVETLGGASYGRVACYSHCEAPQGPRQSRGCNGIVRQSSQDTTNEFLNSLLVEFTGLAQTMTPPGDVGIEGAQQPWQWGECQQDGQWPCEWHVPAQAMHGITTGEDVSVWCDDVQGVGAGRPIESGKCRCQRVILVGTIQKTPQPIETLKPADIRLTKAARPIVDDE